MPVSNPLLHSMVGRKTLKQPGNIAQTNPLMVLSGHEFLMSFLVAYIGERGSL